ncbi:MAG TPA: hypothetical protein VMH32_03075 [Burkholderiales bacterium]|nr:hypothetical protein [Burkholderiales bacterium]
MITLRKFGHRVVSILVRALASARRRGENATSVRSPGIESMQRSYSGVGRSTDSALVRGFKPRDSKGCYLGAVVALIALMLVGAAAGTLLTACAALNAHPSNTTASSAMADCPEQEGYPDCPSQAERDSTQITQAQ